MKDVELYLRVDDFPAWTESMNQFIPAADYEAFHHVLRVHSIPYMIAVTPQPAFCPLDPNDKRTRELTAEECALLKRISNEGATIGLHGVTHRTRAERPHSEFIDIDDNYFVELLNYADCELQRQTGISADVFVPPFNRASMSQFQLLGQRFRVVCGGPETAKAAGGVPPSMIGDEAIFFPSYPPQYGRAHEIEAWLKTAVQAEGRLCLTLHWEWERRRTYDELNRLCVALEGRVHPWDDLIHARVA